jgi:hypothetical protein
MGLEPTSIRITAEGIPNLPRPPPKTLSKKLVLPVGLEPTTPCFEDKCSHPLSHGSNKLVHPVEFERHLLA